LTNCPVLHRASWVDLLAAAEDVVDARPPLWHLGFLNRALAHARHLGEDYLLFGAYPREREERVAGSLRAVVEERRGRVLGAAGAYRAWGERFFPVTPSARYVPDHDREYVALAEVGEVLSRMETGWRPAIQGSVARSGKALLLAIEGGAS